MCGRNISSVQVYEKARVKRKFVSLNCDYHRWSPKCSNYGKYRQRRLHHSLSEAAVCADKIQLYALMSGKLADLTTGKHGE